MERFRPEQVRQSPGSSLFESDPPLGLALRVEDHGVAYEIFESSFVDLGRFMNVDSAANVAIEAGAKQTRGILQRSTFGEGELYSSLVSFQCADNAVVREDGNAIRVRGFGPLLLFDDLGISLVNLSAHRGERMAAPVV